MHEARVQILEEAQVRGVETRVIVEVVRCGKVAKRAVGASQVYVAEWRRQEFHIPAGSSAVLASPNTGGRDCPKLSSGLLQRDSEMLGV